MGMAITGAVALSLGLGAQVAKAADQKAATTTTCTDEKNSCKGQGKCAGKSADGKETNACAGKNSCKGHMLCKEEAAKK